MKVLLVVLSSVAILAGLFSGGCSLIAVANYPQRAVAVISAGVGAWSATLLAANIGVLVALLGRPSPRRRLLARLLGVVDVVLATVALLWLVWADSWSWANPPWPWLAKAGACLMAVKGVLVWRLLGRGPFPTVDAAACEPRRA
jgi:hypothetical protein